MRLPEAHETSLNAALFVILFCGLFVSSPQWTRHLSGLRLDQTETLKSGKEESLFCLSEAIPNQNLKAHVAGVTQAEAFRTQVLTDEQLCAWLPTAGCQWIITEKV